MVGCLQTGSLLTVMRTYLTAIILFNCCELLHSFTKGAKGGTPYHTPFLWPTSLWLEFVEWHRKIWLLHFLIYFPMLGNLYEEILLLSTLKIKMEMHDCWNGIARMWHGNLLNFGGEGHIDAPFLISLVSKFCCRLWRTLSRMSSKAQG